MQAIILAAGMGKRLKSLTKNNTKCMVEVCGVTIIERTLRILDKYSLSKIIIVTGYCGDKLEAYVRGLDVATEVQFIHNSEYNRTNNIFSLSMTREYLIAEDSLILESDIVFEESVIEALLMDKRETLALVDKFESWMDGACMILDENDCIADMIKGRNLQFNNSERYYKTVNIYKFSKYFSSDVYLPFLDAYAKVMGQNEYYESVIKIIAMLGTKDIQAKRLDGQTWYEIDDVQDLDIAETLFENDEKLKINKIMKRYGGYWRYPKLKDYCYLVNPYYPPDKMISEMENNFRVLITNYPSGIEINRLLSAKFSGVKKEYIMIGNGAAEIIKLLLASFEGTCGFIRPTFEEYPNRYDSKKSVVMTIESDDFSYSIEDIISFFDDKDINNLVLINPDNPSGNYICNEDCIRLMEWCRNKGIKLILDTSFEDFADRSECENDESEESIIISDEILTKYKDTLVVVKSLSKSYGVPGIRLGLLMCGDVDLINNIKSETSIWNINSFAEFFLQIADKYKEDYIDSIRRIKKSRKAFFDSLTDIEYIIPIPSNANYIMCKLIGVDSQELTQYLYSRNILIKDLTGKISNGNQYIRLAVKNEEDNAFLIKALHEYEKNH